MGAVDAASNVHGKAIVLLKNIPPNWTIYGAYDLLWKHCGCSFSSLVSGQAFESKLSRIHVLL